MVSFSRSPEIVAPVSDPRIVDYTVEVQELAADELETLGPPCPRDAVFGGCSAVARFVLDYGDLRNRLRAARLED